MSNIKYCAECGRTHRFGSCSAPEPLSPQHRAFIAVAEALVGAWKAPGAGERFGPMTLEEADLEYAVRNLHPQGQRPEGGWYWVRRANDRHSKWYPGQVFDDGLVKYLGAYGYPLEDFILGPRIQEPTD